jgi:Tripartite tricarboxylate transporter TctB family
VTPPDAPSKPAGERWAAAGLTAFGIAGVVGASSLPFGSVTRPGAGFFPLGLAVALTLVSAGLLVRSLRASAGEATAVDLSRRGLVRAGATLAGTLVYALALPSIGFGVATFLLIVFLFRAIEPQRWPVAIGGAAVTVLASHVLFRIWLGVRLPAGPWGF